MDRTPEQAFQIVKGLGPFAPFRDASCGQSCFDLTVLDCLKVGENSSQQLQRLAPTRKNAFSTAFAVQGISKARQAGFLDWHLPSCLFDVEEYEHHEQVQNGDFNWIVPGGCSCPDRSVHSLQLKTQSMMVLLGEALLVWSERHGMHAGKLLAFSGPASSIPLGQSFYRQWCPEDYTEFFRSRDITTIVRLNKQVGSTAARMHSEIHAHLPDTAGHTAGHC